jgi:hypothetical protein
MWVNLAHKGARAHNMFPVVIVKTCPLMSWLMIHPFQIKFNRLIIVFLADRIYGLGYRGLICQKKLEIPMFYNSDQRLHFSPPQAHPPLWYVL